MLLLPQIPKFIAHEIATRVAGMTVSDASRLRASDHALKFFSPIGGTHVNPTLLEQLQSRIELIARGSGYPDQRPADRFDYAATECLHSVLKMSANEASRPGVWQFLACVLMPDIVVWRQGRAGSPVNLDNFLDSTNNLFRRLWWRAAIFEDRSRPTEPYWLLENMLEDAIQTFYERRGLSGVPGMGVAFARVYHATSKLLPPRFNMEPVERTAQKWLVRVAENVAIECLDERSQIRLVANAFAKGLTPPHRSAITDLQIEKAAATLAQGGTVAPLSIPAQQPVAAIESQPPPKPVVRATLFSGEHKKAFGTERGAFSIVTEREASASEINLTGPEAKIAEDFFGRDRIHLGPAKANPLGALQRFREHQTDQLIYLNLVYPKSDRSEMRLYLSQQKGFKPAPGSVWFIYLRKRELYIGWMTLEDWELFLAGKKGSR